MSEFWDPIAQNVLSAIVIGLPAVAVGALAVVRRVQRARRIQAGRAAAAIAGPSTTATLVTAAAVVPPSIADVGEELPDPWWWATAKDIARGAAVAAFLLLVLGGSLWFVWGAAGIAVAWARSGWNFFLGKWRSGPGE